MEDDMTAPESALCPVCYAALYSDVHVTDCPIGARVTEASDAMEALEKAHDEYWKTRRAFAAARKADEVARLASRKAGDALQALLWEATHTP